MKSHSKSSNKTKKQTIKTKPVKKLKIKRTEHAFLSVSTETKLQIVRKAF